MQCLTINQVSVNKNISDHIADIHVGNTTSSKMFKNMGQNTFC